MGTASYSIDNFNVGSNFGKFFLWSGLILAICFTIYMVCEHAIAKHGGDALRVENCLQQKGPHLGTWIRKTDGHIGYPCQLDESTFGVLFNDSTGKNLSAFIKEKFKCAWQVITYLENRDYIPGDEAAWNWYRANMTPCQD